MELPADAQYCHECPGQPMGTVAADIWTVGTIQLTSPTSVEPPPELFLPGAARGMYGSPVASVPETLGSGGSYTYSPFELYRKSRPTSFRTQYPCHQTQ